MSRFSAASAFLLLTTLSTPPFATAEPAWTWPVAAPHQVVRQFDKPPQNWLPGHRGVDISAPPDSLVFSAGDGGVAFAGEVGGKPVVSIQHDNGLRTTYEPVAATVSVGDRISLGDAIGTLVAGHPECEVAACLHWGLRRDGDYLDPLWLVAPRKLRLKPL